MNPHPPRPAPPLNDQGLPMGYPFKPDWEVTPRQVRAMQQAGEDFLLLDCRLPGEYAIAKVDGAELLPLQDLPHHLDDLRDDHAGRPIVVHCHHGVRSMQATAILRQAGFADVKSMAGGIDLWSIAVDPSVRRY